jgi:hypothetical protein
MTRSKENEEDFEAGERTLPLYFFFQIGEARCQ